MELVTMVKVSNKHNYPPEAIRITVEEQNGGRFQRAIVDRTAYDLRLDTLALECGHSVLVSLGRLLPAGITCDDCRSAFFKRACDLLDG